MRRACFVLVGLLLLMATPSGQVGWPDLFAQIIRVPGSLGGGGGDTTNPTVTIDTPTTSPTYDNGAISSINVGGTATDNVSIASCSGSSDRTGAFSVNNTGAFFTASAVALASGSNVLTVTCLDPTGNSGNDAITVTYTPSGGSCSPGGGACIDSGGISDTTPTNGQAITVTGQDLHQETMTGWHSFFTGNSQRWSFEGSSMSSMGYACQGGNCAVQDATLETSGAVLGTKIAMWQSTFSGTCTVGVASDANYVTLNGELTDDIYGKTYVRWTRVQPTNSWPINGFIKWLEWSFNNTYLQPWAETATTVGEQPNGMRIYHIASGNTFAAMPGGLELEDGRTYAIEFHFKRTATTATEVWVDGIQIINNTPATTSAPGYFLLGIINACGENGSPTAWDIQVRMDGFALGSQRIYPSTLLEVCAESTYGSCTTKIPQEVTQISDTQVVFNFRNSRGTLGTIGSGTCYLYATNNELQTSAGEAMTCP